MGGSGMQCSLSLSLVDVLGRFLGVVVVWATPGRLVEHWKSIKGPREAG